MKFSALSENEIKQIENILKRCEVDYTISMDEDTQAANQNSIKDDLRYLNVSTFSSNILCIEISENEFDKIDLESRKELEKYNLFIDQKKDFEYEEVDFDETSTSSLQTMNDHGRVDPGKAFPVEIIGLALFLILAILGVVLKNMIF